MKYSVQELIDVATYGISEPLRKLIALHPPQNDLNRALVAAAAFGKDHCVALLMPVSDVAACSSEALRIAAAEGFSHYVEMFMPLASVEECTQALGEAVKHNHPQCVDLLKPHLNQAELLKITNKIDPSSEVYAALHTLMAQQQHTLLTQEMVAVDGPKSPNKRKI